MTSYIGVIHRKEPNIYGIGFPDFPDCVSAGRTLAEAHAAAKRMLGEHIAIKQGYGETLPTPSDMQAVLSNPAFAEAVAYVSVEAEAPTRIKRISLTMDESLLAQIDARASNRSAFLAEAARYYLRLTS